MNFEVTAEQKQKFVVWKKERENDGANAGAIGGRFTFTFTPTSIGIIVAVKDCLGPAEGNQIDLTNYDEF